jgi:ribonuclease HI
VGRNCRSGCDVERQRTFGSRLPHLHNAPQPPPVHPHLLPSIVAPALTLRRITLDEVITLQFDGGSRGNPGPAGIGVVLRAQDGTPLVTLGRYIGRATNNVAEYRGLITAMQKAKEIGAKKILIRGDSELIVKQMKGEYRVKNADLRVLYEEAQDLIAEFDSAKIEHNYRSDNTLADKLANLAMDRKADVTEANDSDSPLDTPEPIAPKAGDRVSCARCGCVVEIREPSSIRPHQLKPFVCQCGAKME